MNPWNPRARRISGQLLGATLTAALLVSCSHTPRETAAPAPVQEEPWRQVREHHERMVESGALKTFVYTRKRAGKDLLPKHPGKAWEWFVSQRLPIDATIKELPEFYRQRAEEETLKRNMDKSTLKQKAAAWTYLGPGGLERDGTIVQPSGRIPEIAVHPTNSSIIYAAGASGGLFKSTNQGQSWTNITDGALPSLGLGSVRIDPNNPNRVYIGMGEGVPGSQIYEPTGAGVYRSDDAGSTWALMQGTEGFRHVVDIEILDNSSSIMVAAKGRSDGAGAGLFVTRNGGASWTTISTEPFFDIQVNPTNRNVILVTRAFYSTQENSIVGAIFRSTDGGANFTPPTQPPLVNQAGTVGASRIELTQSGSTVYALVAGTDSGIFGIWKSTNSGETFTALPAAGIPTAGDFKPGQMGYNCSIAVAPSNPNVVYIGTNLRMYKTTDGGNNFTAISDWAGGDGLPKVHADHHHFWISNDGNTVYSANDGGFFISTNGGTSWTERNMGFDAVQLYRIGNHPTNRNSVIMGAQDNDKYLRRSDGTWHHYPNTFGDAMEVLCWPNDPNVFVGTNYFGLATQMTPNAGSDWFFIRGYGPPSAGDGIPLNNGIPDNERGAWVSPFMFDPKDPSKLYIALEHVYTTNFNPSQPMQWSRVVTLPAGTPASMELMRFTSGTTNRKLFGFLARRLAPNNQFSVGLWRANVNGTNFEVVDMPRTAIVNAIETDPNNNDTVWIAYSDLRSDFSEQPRIYRSTNLGNTWTDMTNNFPRNLPISAIFIDPQNSNTIILGTDIGAYRSDNGGQSWVYWNEGLPKVVITDFEYFAPDRLLRAGTFGRGMWETALDGTTGTPDIRISPTTINFP